MIRIKLLNKRIKLPSVMKELNLSQGRKIEQMKKEFPRMAQRIPRVISILLGIELGHVNMIDRDSQKELYSHFQFMDGKVEKFTKNHVKIDGVKYAPIDFRKVTCLEFLDLDMYARNNFYDNMHNFLAVCLRPKRRRIIAPYSEFDVEQRAKIFDAKLSYPIGLSIVNDYIQFKQYIVDTYPILFVTDAEQEPDDFDKMVESMNVEQKKLILSEEGMYGTDEEDGEVNMDDVWGIYHSIYQISKGDIIQMKKWMNLPVLEFFYYLMYHKQLNG